MTTTSFGQEFRARRADDRKTVYYSEVITRPITAEEYAWLATLKKPEGKRPVVVDVRKLNRKRRMRKHELQR